MNTTCSRKIKHFLCSKFCCWTKAKKIPSVKELKKSLPIEIVEEAEDQLMSITNNTFKFGWWMLLILNLVLLRQMIGNRNHAGLGIQWGV